MSEQQRTRAALAKLTDVLTGIAHTADEKNRERCPYKTVELSCAYSGGCQNQRRNGSNVHCSGDDLNFAPYALSPTP